MDKFEVVEKISKNIDYNSRNWNKEIIDRYLLKYDDKRIIESMTIIHLKDDIQKDLTVEISNMYIILFNLSLPKKSISIL